MKMRIFFFVLVAFLALFPNANSALAQSRPQDRDAQLQERRQRRAAQLQQARPSERITKRIKQLQVWKLTDRLKLTDEQSAKFFPKYNRYQDELAEELQSLQINIARLEIAQQTDVKDSEIDEQIEAVLSKRRAVSDVLPKYIREFRETLSARQMADLIIFERDFLRDISELIERARKRDGLAGEKELE